LVVGFWGKGESLGIHSVSYKGGGKKRKKKTEKHRIAVYFFLEGREKRRGKGRAPALFESKGGESKVFAFSGGGKRGGKEKEVKD